MKNLDKFYTKKKVAKACLEFLRSNVEIENDAVWLEPSAGNGNFARYLPKNSILLDIAPEHSKISAQDFLTWHSKHRNLICVGNPPFGKNASLALKFVNHAALFSRVVAFILPKTFEKRSMIEKVTTSLTLTHAMSIDSNSFLFDGKSYAVPCTFQIWQRLAKARKPLAPNIYSSDFEFCSKSIADLAIQRVGVNAGTIKQNLTDLSESSHTFIRITSLDKNIVIRRLNSVNFDSIKYATAGNPSISKAEILQLYNEVKKNDD